MSLTLATAPVSQPVTVTDLAATLPPRIDLSDVTLPWPIDTLVVREGSDYRSRVTVHLTDFEVFLVAQAMLPCGTHRSAYSFDNLVEAMASPLFTAASECASMREAGLRPSQVAAYRWRSALVTTAAWES